MFDLVEFRALLGTAADELTDDEIERIRTADYELADAIIDWWLRKRTFPP